MALIGDVYLRKLLGANSISKVDKRNEQRGDSFYVHDNLNETKIAPTARPDKFVTPVKDTASLVPRDTSPGPRKTPDIKTNSPGRGRGRGRGGRA